MKIKVVLFDLDRTLVNLADYVNWSEARKAVAKVYIKLGVSPRIVMKYYSSLTLYTKMYRLAESFDKEAFERMQHEASKVIEKYEMQALNKTKPFSGCLKVLERIKARGIKIGIVSGNSEETVHQVLKKLGIINYVDAVFSRDSTGRPKPYPDHILACLRKLRCKPENAIFVGDSISDAKAAESAGVFFVGVLSGRFLREEFIECGVNKIIDDVRLLPSLVSTLESECT